MSTTCCARASQRYLHHIDVAVFLLTFQEDVLLSKNWQPVNPCSEQEDPPPASSHRPPALPHGPGGERDTPFS